MQPAFLRTIQRYFQNASQWFWKTPERALDQAYDAVLMIKVLENEYFGGGKIPTSSTNSTKYGANTLACIQADLRKYLRLAEIRLSEFKVSRLIVDSTSWEISNPAGAAPADSRLQDRDRIALLLDELNTNGSPPIRASQNRERMAGILEKLKFIDEVLERYKPRKMASTAMLPLPPAQGDIPTASDLVREDSQTKQPSSQPNPDQDEGMLDKTGVLPRSILGTVNRIKRELDPKSEMQIIESFRNTKAKTLISIRFLLLLIIIPLLTQQLSKAMVVGPIVDHFYSPSQPFINSALQETALEELRIFEERLHFDLLLGKFPETTTGPAQTKLDEEKAEQEIRQRVKQKVVEIAQEYTKQSTNAIKNVFADLLSLIAFALVIFTNQPEIAVLKSFIDEMVYGLSDSAKAFIIILFTDIFVGFHSPHGWEILLEGISRHLGLPASRDFIFLFIATFPVILDTIFKYWIFRYLNRISPSAVATYRSMNE